jgi:hypothetical protein
VKKVQESVDTQSRIGVGELRVAAESVLLEAVRQAPHLHFTMDEVTTYIPVHKVRKVLGMSKEDTRDLDPILTAAAGKLNKKLHSFQVSREPWYYGDCKFVARLADDAEWKDAVSEAWSFADHKNECDLTDAGVALLQFIRSGKLESDFMTERSLTWKIGFNGRENCLKPYLYEIVDKTGVGLHWEAKGTHYGERPMFRLWVDSAEPPQPVIEPALNPVFDLHLDRFSKADLDSVRSMIYDGLFKLNPAGAAEICCIAISTRGELRRCFPQARSRKSNVLVEFFSVIPFNESLELAYDFREKVPLWTLVLEPQEDWETALAAIRDELAQPSLQVQFGLSDDAAKLVNWIEGLPEDKKLLGRVTPIAEDAAEKWIGIECPWSEENTAVYLQLLVDEINEHTSYDLTLQPWREYNRVKTRIIIRGKRPRIEDVLSQLRQIFAERGRSWDGDTIRAALERLLSPG